MKPRSKNEKKYMDIIDGVSEILQPLENGEQSLTRGELINLMTEQLAKLSEISNVSVEIKQNLEICIGRIYWICAQAYFNAQDFKNALNMTLNADEVLPGSPDVKEMKIQCYCCLAEAAENAGRYQAALDYYQRAKKLKPKDEEVKAGINEQIKKITVMMKENKLEVFTSKIQQHAHKLHKPVARKPEPNIKSESPSPQKEFVKYNQSQSDFYQRENRVRPPSSHSAPVHHVTQPRGRSGSGKK